MTLLGVYLAASWTILFGYSVAMPDLHLQMSADQLREVFHVEHPGAVPHYEVVQLTHHTNAPLRLGLHQRRKRSIDTGGPPNSFPAFSGGNDLPASSKHHVKKDLSKVPFSGKVSESLFPPKRKFVGPVPVEQSSQLPEEVQPQQQNARGEDSDSETVNGISDVSLSDIKEHRVSFSAFGDSVNLTLQKTEGLFRQGEPHSLRMWNVRVDPNATQGLVYEEIHDENAPEEDHFGNVYQDQKNMAAVLMRRHLESGDLIMEGSIGHQLVIKPVPTEISQAEDGSVHHVIYKRTVDEQNHDDTSDYAFMEPDRLQKRFRSKRQAYYKQSRVLDTTIYPEILVIVDYDGYRLHGGDNVQVKRYFVSFWNGVDLRYRLLKGPKVRISIAGIIISRGRDATPYLERNRVGRDAIDSAAALTDMGKYLFRERRLPVYDIAVAITKYDMCRRRKGGRCTKGTAGFAYVGGACVVNKRLEKVNSVAIIEDTGGFSGIIVAAHEVGHLLGAVHDGSPPPSYLGGPGAEKCRWEDGYIMSDLRHTERGFRWSPCSVQSFHHFLNGDTASCLQNPPHEDEALGRSLPGTLLSLDAQCRRDRGTSACFKDERVCAQLFCFDSASGYCVAYRPAAEGSTCGDGQHCLDGRCVAEHENIIPDYSQHTPSYTRFNQPQQPSVKFNYDDKSGQQGEYYEPSSSTASSTTSTTTSTTSTTTTTTTTTTTPPPPPPTSTRNYYQYFNHKSTSTYHMDDETDRRYKNFMNAIKRKRLQHLKEQLRQQEIVSNQQ
ncbi:A disintegrin and metalloproteinase with thrombospondin motifs like isoform X2 [Uranotaenia lowii]|uniref:A disintegrin and metalloproteinase with thrombospondin motifs like isoform X2 n=1 Tax=Uranotaenia lowii TaxID=190385 RepID=UPI0024792EEB|nr:A disintegrin and metalloproteinase with thrombospondin motifs like isoform X2 [Uranotaenia lowii]